jgi:predicted nucleic acid-binding protein
LEIVEAENAVLCWLHEGEAAAIALAVSLHPDLLLMDDRKGVKTASLKAFT